MIGAALLAGMAAAPPGQDRLVVEASRGDVAFATGDYATALQAFQAQADAGDPSAMLAMGVLYDTGHGVKQDFAAALHWYRRAADAGNASGMFNVAVMLDNGIGTTRDLPQALGWYRRAADAGSGRAAFDLGLIYRDGDGAGRDRDAAIRYFTMAARAGVRAARTNLARLGAPGAAPPAAALPRLPARSGPVLASAQQDILKRVNPDDAGRAVLRTAFPALLAKALDGDHAAQYGVAWAYQYGEGPPADQIRAFVYYLRAAASLDQALRTPALQGAAEIAPALSPEQRQTARTMLLDETP